MFTHTFHQFGQKFAHILVTIGGDSAHIGNLFLALHGLGAGLEVLDHLFHCEVDAATEIHRVHAGSDALAAFTEDGTGEDSGGRGAVTGDIVSLAGDLLDQRSADVLETVRELNGSGHGDTILGDFRGTKGLVNDHIAALRTQGHLDGIGQLVGTSQDGLAAFSAEEDLLASEMESGSTR